MSATGRLMLALFLCLGPLFSRPACAQQETLSLTEYRAPEGCPPAWWFAWRIALRTTRVAFAERNQAADTEVRVSVDESGRQGLLEWGKAGSDAMSRRVSGSSCQEVVDGMALITAMAMDPSVTVHRLGTTGSTSFEPLSAEPVAPPAEPNAVRARTPMAPKKRIVAPPLAPKQAREPRDRTWASVGLGPALAYGAGPGFTPGFSLWFLGELMQEPLWDLAALLTLEVDSRGTIEVTEGSARFVRVIGRVGGCPFRWELAPGLGVRPCGVFEAGVLRGRGVDVADHRAESATWLAPGLMLRTEACLSRHFFLTLDGTGTIPLAHDRFLFSPDAEIFTIPTVAYALSLSLGASF